MEDILKKSVRVVTAPTFEPVTLTEAKLWCRVDEDDTDQDAMLLLLIIAMREYAEELTGRAFVSRTLEMRMDGFPEDGDPIELPYTPLHSVSSIQYVDADGDLQSLEASPTDWQVDTVSEPGRVAPSTDDGLWPDTREDELGAVRITFVAGYANVNAIPKKVRLWMQARIATLFEHREQIVTGSVAAIPKDFTDGLLDGLRVHTGFA